jgi:hypothetical protein
MIRRISAHGQPRQKASMTLSQTIKTGQGAHTCHPSKARNVNRKIIARLAQA